MHTIHTYDAQFLNYLQSIAGIDVSSEEACNYSLANQFLKLLAPNTRNFCFRTIDPKKVNPPQNHTGSLKQLFSELKTLNCAKRDGIFVVINEGGHRDNNIDRIRALFCDWDEPETALQLCEEAAKRLEPHIIVESSPGKRHAYWLVNDIAVDRFRLWQEHLIELFYADKTIKNESRVMRLPGFFHTKNELFMTKIIHETARNPYNESDLIVAFGEPEIKQIKATLAANHANSANSANLNNDAESIYITRAINILKSATPGNRHAARLKAGTLAGGFIAGGLVSESKITDCLMQASDSIANNNVTDPIEKKTLLDAIANGKAVPISQQHIASKVIANSFDNQPVQPELLRAPIPSAETYPVQMLGEVLGAAALALHETIKAPLALCCQSVLASASLAAQTHFDVMMPWGGTKPLSLFFLTVAESGERKSGVDDVVLGAAKAQERLEMDAYRTAQQKYEEDIAVYESANKAAGKAKTGQSTSDHQAATKHQAEQKPEKPIMPLRFVTDPTVEGLFKLLAIGQPSVGLFSDEAGLLIGGNALNSDNALKTMARWCKFWDGAPFDRVRAGDAGGILYGRRMAMHQLAQPEVMVKLLGDRMANGQGFLSRCLVAWPQSTIGSRHVDSYDWPKNRTEVKRLLANFKTLFEAEPRTFKSKQELDPIELRLEEIAIPIALKAQNAFETLMQKGNDLSEMTDRAAKALENACRIAGVLAVIDGGMETRSISAAHLSRALVIVQWYLSESLRIRGTAVVPQAVIDAESLSVWLNERGMTVFRTEPILTKGPSQLRNKLRLKAAISELVSNGYLSENKTGMVIEGVKCRASWTVLHVV